MPTSTGYDVSLIVPIYNVEEFLAECLASIEAQTIFERVEVLLVDDGSTDSSGAIAADFADRHPNARLITRANGGLGAARNTGVASASAPMLAFLDSDDVLPPRSIEIRLAAMTEDVELVVGNMETFPSPTRWPWSARVAEGDAVLAGVETFPELIHNTSACNKLFRAESFPESGFPERIHFEDAFLVIPEVLRAKRISILTETVYLYRRRVQGGSIMDSLFTRAGNYWDHLALAEHLTREMKGHLEERQSAVRRFLVRSTQGFLTRAPGVLSAERLPTFYARMQAIFRHFPVEEIVESTQGLNGRIAFAAFALDDYELFSDRWTHTEGLEAVGGLPYLKVHADVDEAILPMLAAKGTEVYIERVAGSAAEKFLTVSGRVDLPGVPAAGVAGRVKVRIASKGEALCAPTTTQVRRVADVVRAVTTLEWTAEVPASKLKTGRWTLDAHVLVPGSQFTVRARPSLGLRRRSAMVRTRSTRSLFVPGSQARLTILTRRNSRRANRLRWKLMLIREDLRGLWERRPFAWTRIGRLLTSPFAGSSPLWLVGERGDTAQDNGYRFFEWARKNTDGIRVRYVLDRKSDAWKSLADRKGVVRRGSLRHKLLFLHSDALISSQDFDAYMIPPKWNREHYRTHLAHRLDQKRIFLQHGIIFNDVAAPLAREHTGLDMFVTSVEPEYEYLRQHTRFTHELKLTGMPRYDTLVRTPSKQILLMPTWRKYLVLPSYASGGNDPGTFHGSAYERFFTDLLQSPRLATVLEKHDHSLAFAPHYEVVDHFADIEVASTRITVTGATGVRTQEMIRSAAVFMTDYTSVMFDAAYLGVPVLQMPFDLEEFHERHYGQGWLDNGGGEYWPVARTVEEAVDALDAILSAGAVVASEHQARIDRLFPRRDRENSRRVYEAIRALPD
ncbi:glycosyltransferase [Microbacterium sp. NPDC057659]|uniref:bifunctional glycosyltransferase/CDP-glycerol:glycerophosphate glycerophosphotransferase n=1 Tax=Microbacterium sp. NPDC057659 TaxID=3346198 RepID=UPI00366EFF84